MKMPSMKPEDFKMPDEAKLMPKQHPKVTGDGWAQPYTAFLNNGQHAFAHWIQDAIDLSQEISHFIRERLQEDIAASVALGACRSAEDLIDCQRRFANKAAEQYSEEIGKLSQMMMKLATAGLSSCAPDRRPQDT
jgi:hypothetical protein